MNRISQHLRNMGIVAALGLLAIVLFRHGSHMQIVTLVMIWATFAYGWNVLGGYAGQMSAGHSMYFGIGAFVPTLMFRNWDVPPSIGIFAGIGLAVFAALLIGWPTFRLSGVYFTLATLAYPLMAIPLVVKQGWSEVSSPLVRENAAWYFQFDSAASTALLALGVLLIAVLITSVIDTSNLGLSMRAVRDNESAAEAAGINTFRVKMKAIAISAAMSAAAGTIMVSSVLYIATPQYLLGFQLSVNVLIMAFVGGSGSIWGPLLGAAIIIPTTDLLTARFGATLPGLNGVLLGGVLVLVVLFAPTGIWGKIRTFAGRSRQSRQAGTPVASDVDEEQGATDAALEQAPAPRPASPPVELGDVILRTDLLSRHYGGLRAVDGVSLEVREGELLGVIGPNGAGKTTLFDTIGGHTVPTSGRVFVGGVEATGQKAHRLCRLGLARTFQVVRTFEEMSVFNNVRVGALVTGGSDKEIVEIVDDVLELVGLSDHRDEPVTALNTADLRRMEFARALASKPKIVLADECLAGLGGHDVQIVVDLLRDIRDSGVTVVVIEHTMAAMVGLVDRFVVLDHGAVIADGDPAAVVKIPNVIEAYLGKKWMSNATA